MSPGATAVTAGRGELTRAGGLMVALGFIRAFLPLKSTTIFLILATGCFAQSGIWNAITR